MSKITKKSVNALMDIYKNQNPDVVLKLTNPSNKDEVVMEISVKTDLSIPEKGIFVDRVVNSCFDVDGDFMPQYLDPVFMITLLQMTTNVPPIEDVIPVLDDTGNETGEKSTLINIEKTYELCKAINLVKNVTDTKYQALIGELRQMVADKLAYVKDINARKASNPLVMLKPLLAAVNDVEENKKFLETLTQITNAMDSVSMEASNIIPISDGK